MHGTDAPSAAIPEGSAVDADAVWGPLEAAGDPFGDAVEEAVELARSGVPVAVVGAPFGGRGRVLDRVADRLDARRLTLGAGDAPPGLDDPTVLDGAGRLHTREVDGFDRLERFFERVATAETPLVTGWNAYAWDYCRQARDAGRRLEHVAVPAVDREAVAALVREWGTGVTFRAAPREATALLSVDHRSVSVPAVGEVSVPVVRPNPGALAARSTDEGPEAAVVRRLTECSAGNPGVARALWETCVDGVVSTADIRTPVAAARETETERERRTADSGPGTPSGTDPGETALDRYDAVCLRVVLAGESLPRDAVAAALGPVGRDTDAVLARLERRGYLAVDDGRVGVRPAAVPDAVAVTERRRVP